MVKALGDRPGALWLEPSHGQGVFIQAMAEVGVRRERIVAVDLDTTPFSADAMARTFRGVDFLNWAREIGQKFDRVIGNPPFISIKRLPEAAQKVAASTLDLSGRPIGRGANVWYAFVLASMSILNKGGCLAFVLPSAAEFADYSAGIRGAMRSTFASLELYRCNRPLFMNVQEGTLVAIARGYRSPEACRVRRLRFPSRDALIQGLARSGRITGHKCPHNIAPCSKQTVTLESIAKIQLGGVTGHASFFLFTEKKRKELDLPVAAFTPVITRAKHLRQGSINRNAWKDLKSAGERIWLFNPTAKMVSDPRVEYYLNLDSKLGGCNRDAYKVSRRKPWYTTPLPKSPDAFLSGMSQTGPWLCMNEMRDLNATNTLYVVTFLNRNVADWYACALALFSSIVQQQIRRVGRRYADGLIKYEPGPLGRIELPKLRRDVDHKSFYARAVNALLTGDSATAREIADSLRL